MGYVALHSAGGNAFDVVKCGVIDQGTYFYGFRQQAEDFPGSLVAPEAGAVIAVIAAFHVRSSLLRPSFQFQHNAFFLVPHKPSRLVRGGPHLMIIEPDRFDVAG